MSDNPYETPKAELGSPAEKGERITHLIKGQRYIIYAFVLYFAAVAVAFFVPVLAWIVLVVAFIFGVVGFFRALIGVDYHIVLKIVMGILMFVPLVNVLALLALNSRVTYRLRRAGYSVGFFGVRA